MTLFVPATNMYCLNVYLHVRITCKTTWAPGVPSWLRGHRSPSRARDVEHRRVRAKRLRRVDPHLRREAVPGARIGRLCADVVDARIPYRRFRPCGRMSFRHRRMIHTLNKEAIAVNPIAPSMRVGWPSKSAALSPFTSAVATP